jgi:pimeloyl-ACP methyl ester carboxylesterase
MRSIVRGAQSGDVESTIRRGRESSPLWADDEWLPWAEAKARVSPHFLDAMSSGVAIGQDWRDLLARVRCPVLLVTADPERGAIVAPEAAQEAKQILPSLEVVRLSGAGHNIRREQFDSFVAGVRGFLAAHYAPAEIAAG